MMTDNLIIPKMKIHIELKIRLTLKTIWKKICDNFFNVLFQRRKVF